MTTALRKQGYLFICTIFACLFLFALAFYFERLNSDAGYYFFHITNTRWFHVEHGRLVLVLAEMLPTLGSLLHLPLKMLAVLYSLNHVLFFAILAFTCLRRFNDMNAAVLIAVLQFAGLKFSVFTPQFELYYGLALLVFSMAYVRFTDTLNTKWKLKNYALFSVLLVFIFTSHPMAVYCYFACICIYFSDREHLHLLLYSLAFFVVYFLWKKISISEYEQSKLSGFTNAFNGHSAGYYLNSRFLTNGSSFLMQHYADVLLVFITGLIYAFKDRSYKQLIVTLIFITGSLAIIWLMFEPATMGRYIEQVYFPFVFIACLWLFKCRLNGVIMVLLVLGFGYRAYLITDTGFAYRERTMQMEKFITVAQQQEGSKFFVTEEQMGSRLYAQGNWSFGFETLFHSAMHCKKTVTITKEEDLDHNDNRHHLKPADFLFRPFDIMPISALNSQYFKLEEGEYELLLTGKK